MKKKYFEFCPPPTWKIFVQRLIKSDDVLLLLLKTFFSGIFPGTKDAFPAERFIT